MARVYEKMGFQVLPRELEEIGLENTSQYDHYEDETKQADISPANRRARAHATSAELEMARGHIVAWSHNANGNVMSRAHTNPILETRVYQVEFARGKVTKFTANAIAESVYAQCKMDGNE